MSNDDTKGVEHTGENSENLGDLLRNARERRDLSADDLARSLRLESRIIHQLENNQFDQLPVPAFTRGYVRSIAKELQIEDEPLIAMLDQRFTRDPPALADFESRAPTQITSDSMIIRYATLALVIVMVIMVALWWQARDGSLSATSSLWQEPREAEPEPTEPLDYEFETVIHPQDAYFQAGAGSDSGTNQVSESSQPTPVQSEIENTEEEPVVNAGGEIVLTTTQEAWVEVRDTVGERLYYNMLKPGRELRLNGKPPYALTIGNAPAVSLSFNGSSVDLGPVIIDGIARLELGRTSPSP